MQKSTRYVPKDEPESNPDNKPRVVLDTNVLVSAFLTPKGLPAQIVNLAWQGKLQPCYNQEIIDEYEEILARPGFKFKIPQQDIKEVIGTIKKDGLSYDVEPSIFSTPDETDRVFYDVAKASGAFLITNNVKHYPKDKFIFTPSDFVDTFLDPSERTNTAFAAQVLERLKKQDDR